MLEPTAIHSYEAPAWKIRPHSPIIGPPPSLPFTCLVLESPDSPAGPSPFLLHLLRELKCRLVLCLNPEPPEDLKEPEEEASTFGRKPAALHSEWYDAVFDKVLQISCQEGSGDSPLERYFADEGIAAHEALCFACTETGTSAFAAVDAGLVIAPLHNQVWRTTEDGELFMLGADIAAPQSGSPTVRQLAWLHTVFTQKLWIPCLWMHPPPDELRSMPGDEPSASVRAELTSVASSKISARGHPPWVIQDTTEEHLAPCKYRCDEDDRMLVCPDWTPLEPRLGQGWDARTPADFKNVPLYCHSLDVGIAQVNHLLEACDDGLRVRFSSRRFVNLARPGQAATELSVTVLEGRNPPDLVIRSSLNDEHAPPGYSVREDESFHPIDPNDFSLEAAYVEESTGRIILVRAWHSLVKDDGRGDVAMEGTGVRLVSNPRRAIEFVFSNIRRGTRYTVEKMVEVYCGNDSSGLPQDLVRTLSGSPQIVPLIPPPTPAYRIGAPLQRQSSMLNIPTSYPAAPASPSSDSMRVLAEIEEEHRSAWRDHWDRADIEITGTRLSMLCQRFMRLHRFHQISTGVIGPASRTKGDHGPPPLVRDFLQVAFDKLYEAAPHDTVDSGMDFPSSVVAQRVKVEDPRDPPIIRVEPNVPPACHLIRFNVALGQQWHRFTLTPGKVRILVQGPVLAKSPLVQIHRLDTRQRPKFVIKSADAANIVEVRPSPWHEVVVHHALTDLGCPDGSTGGFYSLMRRTRFMRTEVVRRIFSGAEDALDYKDHTLTDPLRNALDSLKSVPRPPGWRGSDDKDLHMLEADSTTRARVVLAYEKNELARDIAFLEGHVFKREGYDLQGEDLLGSGEEMTVEDAKEKFKDLDGCRGFAFQNHGKEGDKVKVHFKSKNRVERDGWTSYEYVPDGQEALMELLKIDHEEKFRKRRSEDSFSFRWVERYHHLDSDAIRRQVEARAYCQPYEAAPDDFAVPPWDDIISCTMKVLDIAVAANADEKSSGGEVSPARGCECDIQKKDFLNFITDRDGTINNYCTRYASSVQSAYTAAFLSHFAKNCTENSVIITAAPLGGHPSAEGLMELCVAPRGSFIYSGSKGREYFDFTTQRVLEAEELPQDQRELIEELHKKLLALCVQPGNTKFLGLGSGLQRKFGEVTMARNDPEGTVPEPESRRFMAAVREVKEELDPDGTLLDLHDTGTDLEIFPRIQGGRASFDKGSGIRCLDKKLHLRMDNGPNLVCGDTGSDYPMVEASLRLMCGDKVVDAWIERISKEKHETDLPERQTSGDSSEVVIEHVDVEVESQAGTDAADSQDSELAKELEEKRKFKEEEEEAREATQKLAVIFVIAPWKITENADEDKQKKELEVQDKQLKLARKVERLCWEARAPCVLVPSPDVLIGSLAKYATQVSHQRIILGEHGDESPGLSPLHSGEIFPAPEQG